MKNNIKGSGISRKFLITAAICFVTLVFAFCGASGASAQTNLSPIKIMIAEGEYEKAETSLKDHIKANPSDHEAHFTLGNLYLKKEKYGEAADEFKEALKLQPSNINYKISVADALFQKGDLDAALTSYNTLIDEGEKTSHICRQVAQIYYRKNDNAKAEEALNEALKINPAQTDIYIQLAQVQSAAGKNKEAAENYEKATAQGNQPAEVLYSLAAAYENCGETDKAIKTYETIAKDYPGERDAYLKLIKLYRDKNNITASVGAWFSYSFFGASIDKLLLFFLSIGFIFFFFFMAFRVLNSILLFPIILILGATKNVSSLENMAKLTSIYAIDILTLLCYYEITLIDPAHAEAWRQMGMYHERKGKPEQAEACFKKSIESNPKRSEGWFSLGQILLGKDKAKEAELNFKKALELDQDNFMIWYYLGLSLYEQGSYEEAAEASRHAIEINKSFSPALDLLIESSESYGNLKIVGETLEDLLRAEPRNIKYLIEMGNVLLTTGKAKDSLIHFEKSIEVAPESFEAWYNFGLAQREAGLLDNAEVSIQKSLELAPNSAWIYASFGLTYIMKNQFQRAEEVIKQSLTLDPGSSYSHYLMGLLTKDKNPELSKTHLRFAVDYFKSESKTTAKPWHKANEFECLGLVHFLSGNKKEAEEALNNAVKFAQATPDGIWIFSEEKMKLTSREDFLAECNKKLQEIIPGGKKIEEA
ncbi:MAG: tetratricopeptide repeat protein [Firmicutes bacterium]|nr:tetratricopeptide repeat protein [Bacillota bacterium]